MKRILDFDVTSKEFMDLAKARAKSHGKLINEHDFLAGFFDCFNLIEAEKSGTTCKHCGEPIRKKGGLWVHEDPNEDPIADNYGWYVCRNNNMKIAEPSEPSE